MENVIKTIGDGFPPESQLKIATLEDSWFLHCRFFDTSTDTKIKYNEIK